MTSNVPGVLQKQGPIATLAGGLDLGYYDKFLFNGEQFIHFVSSVPKVVEASAHKTLTLVSDIDASVRISYASYVDETGTFRFVNGSPTYDGTYTGTPTGEYDHVVVGYDSPLTTSTVKFWTEEYVPTELVRVDYGYDGSSWYNVPTHEGNVTFEFDPNLKLYSDESAPTGQYVYTVDLGKAYTASYWRIRAFIGLHTMSQTGPPFDGVGEDLTMSTTSGLPPTSSYYQKGSFRQATGTISEDDVDTLTTLRYKSSSSHPQAVTWSGVLYDSDADITTVTGLQLYEDEFFATNSIYYRGGVALPGWIDSFSYKLFERYPVYDFSRAVLVDPAPIRGTVKVPCTSIPDRFRWPNCDQWDIWETNINECWEIVYATPETYIVDYVGNWCYRTGWRVNWHTDYYGSIESNEPFYIDWEQSFAAKTQQGFSDTYLPGDTGPHGTPIKAFAEITSFSGVESPPTGQQVIQAEAGARVIYTDVTNDVLNNVRSSLWSYYTKLKSGVFFIYQYPLKITQVAIQERDQALLKYWESDGEISTVQPIDDPNILDITYDSADSTFYAVFISESRVTTPNVDDLFEDTEIDVRRWITSGAGIYLDTVNSGIVFSNSGPSSTSLGSLTNRYFYADDFTGTLPALVTSFSGTSSNYYGLSYVDFDTYNTAAVVAITGDWDVSGTREVSAVIVSDFKNISDDAFIVSGLQIDPRNLPSGHYDHKYEYINGRWYYTRKPESQNCDVCGLDVGVGARVTASGTSLVVDATTAIQEYSFVSFATNKNTDIGITNSGIDLIADYVVSTKTFTLSYNDGVDDFIVLTGSPGNYTETGYTPIISGKAKNTAYVFSSDYTSVGGAYEVAGSLKLAAIDTDGHRQEITGVTDANGIAIASLDVLDENLDYGYYLGRVFLTTDHRTESEGGSVFILVEDDIYKYNKTTLPIGTDDGTLTAIFGKSVVQDLNTRGFGYDNFVNGGLHYLVYDDSRDIVVLRELSSATLLPVGYEVELDVESVRAPIAADPVDGDTLYVVEDDDVYVMNIDANSVAFCNVVVDDPVIPANSGYQTSVTAFVTNLYGDPLSNKLVTFSVTNGGGAVSPSTSCTTSSGTASTVFTADVVVGTSIITATATNTAC